MVADLVGELSARGLVHQATRDDLEEALQAGPITAYIGFDPTAASLHVGSLLPLLALVRVQRAGHRPIALVGGGTGLIGDPSGKESERSMLDADTLARNVAGLREQMGRFLEFGDGPRDAVLIDNAEWLRSIGLLEFLRDVGKHFSVNQMVVRDSVRMRLEQRDHGISYTEFSYMLLQAYDYFELHRRLGCTLQMGGSDQWGNIVSGCDLVRRKTGAVVDGLTMPLVTRGDGKKFGKSEHGNVWLDAELTSPYEFYQFWLNADDGDAARYLHYFTMRPPAEIDELVAAAAAAPEKREAQRELARDVTRLVHGDAAMQRAEHTTGILFGGGDWRQLSAEALGEAFRQSPHSRLPRAALGTPDASLVAVLAATGLSPSRGQARQAVQSGAISINNVREADVGRVLGDDDLLAGTFVVLRRGKKAYHVLEVGG